MLHAQPHLELQDAGQLDFSSACVVLRQQRRGPGLFSWAYTSICACVTLRATEKVPRVSSDPGLATLTRLLLAHWHHSVEWLQCHHHWVEPVAGVFQPEIGTCPVSLGTNLSSDSTLGFGESSSSCHGKKMGTGDPKIRQVSWVQAFQLAAFPF